MKNDELVNLITDDTELIRLESIARAWQVASTSEHPLSSFSHKDGLFPFSPTVANKESGRTYSSLGDKASGELGGEISLVL